MPAQASVGARVQAQLKVLVPAPPGAAVDHHRPAATLPLYAAKGSVRGSVCAVVGVVVKEFRPSLRNLACESANAKITPPPNTSQPDLNVFVVMNEVAPLVDEEHPAEVGT